MQRTGTAVGLIPRKRLCQFVRSENGKKKQRQQPDSFPAPLLQPQPPSDFPFHRYDNHNLCGERLFHTANKDQKNEQRLVASHSTVRRTHRHPLALPPAAVAFRAPPAPSQFSPLALCLRHRPVELHYRRCCRPRIFD